MAKKRKSPARRSYARRRSVGKIGTLGTVALVAGAGLLIYAVTRPKTPVVTYPPGYYPGSTYPPATGANPYVQLGSSVADALSNIFG